MKLGVHDIYNGIPAYRIIDKVFVNNSDVTTRCFYVDDENGEAGCYKVNSEGKFYVGPDGNVAEETLHGKMDIILKSGVTT